MTKIIKTLGVLLLFATAQIVNAQTTFNYKDDFQSILAKTKDPKDNLNYEKLLNRFVKNDTTLTHFEVLALLIGFTDKPEYKPYGDLQMEREIYNLNDDGKYKEGLKAANAFLKKHPLSQKALIEKSYSFYKLGNQDSANYYSYQFRRIMQAMDFSGDGDKNPIFALGPADGQDYITKHLACKIGMMGSGRDKNGYFLDMLEAIPKDGSDPYTLNFIIQHATEKMFLFDELETIDKPKKKKKK